MDMGKTSTADRSIIVLKCQRSRSSIHAHAQTRISPSHNNYNLWTIPQLSSQVNVAVITGVFITRELRDDHLMIVIDGSMFRCDRWIGWQSIGKPVNFRKRSATNRDAPQQKCAESTEQTGQKKETDQLEGRLLECRPCYRGICRCSAVNNKSTAHRGLPTKWVIIAWVKRTASNRYVHSIAHLKCW